MMLAVVAALVALPGAASAGSTTWQDPVRLGGERDMSLEVSAANAAGAAVVIWRDYQATGLFASYRSASGQWGEPELVDPHGNRPGHAAVAVDAQGVATIVYSRCDGCGMRARRRAVDGTWSADVVLDDLGTPDQDLQRPYASADAPQVAVGPDGRVTAVWVSRTRSYKQHSVRTSTFGGGQWSAVQTVSDGLHTETFYVYETRQATVDVDEDGRAVIAWLFERKDGDNHGWSDNPASVRIAVRAADATAFGPDIVLDERTASSRPGMPEVGLVDGVATVAWPTDLYNGEAIYQSEVRARRYSVGSGLGPVTYLARARAGRRPPPRCQARRRPQR
jgi:hypothetical protein